MKRMIELGIAVMGVLICFSGCSDSALADAALIAEWVAEGMPDSSGGGEYSGKSGWQGESSAGDEEPSKYDDGLTEESAPAGSRLAWTDEGVARGVIYMSLAVPLTEDWKSRVFSREKYVGNLPSVFDSEPTVQELFHYLVKNYMANDPMYAEVIAAGNTVSFEVDAYDGSNSHIFFAYYRESEDEWTHNSETVPWDSGVCDLLNYPALPKYNAARQLGGTSIPDPYEVILRMSVEPKI